MTMPRKRKGTGQLPFGENLRKIMSERNLTLREIGELAGVGISVVESWLSKSNPHDLVAVGRLSEKLGVPFKKLVLGANDPVDPSLTIDEMYDENDLIEGLCRVSIKRLVLKNKK